VIESADGQWLTVEQVAERLGLATTTVRSLVASGDLAADFVVPSPRPKLRRRVARIRPDDVEDFVARARVTPGDLAHLYSPQPSNINR
jgi:excisionase family DNA binding protein